MRDHMINWMMPAEPLGPAIRPVELSKAEAKQYLTDDAAKRFATGDHMLPGMKQSDFPKEYDTQAAIGDRFMIAYKKALLNGGFNLREDRPFTATWKEITDFAKYLDL